MRRNGLCVRTKITAEQNLPHLYEESDASSKNNIADDFSGSDNSFWVSMLVANYDMQQSGFVQINY
jgi:hypothetical protein